MADHAAFDLLHPGLQKRLWKMQWPELRPLQVAAIKHVSAGGGDAILSGATASGKTEAAFLPILSAIADDPNGSVRVIYVGPLKALINDQFARVEDLCREMNIPVHRWHGDVPASAKKKLVERPAGVLLLTPESLESLFVNRSTALIKVLGGVRFVVIDELHAFLGNERGLHLRSLLYRLARLTTDPPRIVGLSATLGDPSIAQAYIDADQPGSVTVIKGDESVQETKLKLHAYIVTPARMPDDEQDTTEIDSGLVDPMTEDLIAHCRGHTNLVFANSRNDVELYGERCRRLAAERGLVDRFLVHHGSLGVELRHDVERTMKGASDGRPVTTFCSSTLEMGIDIGQVKMVGQIGAPHSVASTSQRAGRSGRCDGEARILRLYVSCEPVDEKTRLLDRLHLNLVRAVAIVELMLAKWSEPAETSTFDLSTLTQQIISCIAERGDDRADRLYSSLCRTGVFRDVDHETYVELLRQLIREDVIEQTAEGTLILGLAGEIIRKDKGFYAVFPTADDFAVLHDGQKIGAVAMPPPPGHHMILAARRWAVVDVDLRQKTVYVVPSRGYKPTTFQSGGVDIHDRVVREMRKVLASSERFSYLNPLATELLTDARATAERLDICRQRFVSIGTSATVILTWSGSIATATLEAMLKSSGLKVENYTIGVQVNCSVDEAKKLIDQLATRPPDDAAIAELLIGGQAGKYDYLLGDDLRNMVKIRRRLNLPLGVFDAVASSDKG
jgi:ATP-dependent Lhr-like helicase